MPIVDVAGVIWHSLCDWWDNARNLVLANVAWLALSVTVVLLPPATAGLYVVTNRVAYGQKARTEDFIAGARRYGWLGVQWTLVNLAVFGALYGGLHTSPPALCQLALTLLGLVWYSLQFYTWPLLLEQPQKRLLAALRHTFLLGMAAPEYTLLLMIFVGLVVLLSLLTVIPVGLFLVSFLALLGNHAVIDRLATFGQPPDPDHLSITAPP